MNALARPCFCTITKSFPAAQTTGCFAAKNPLGAIWVATTFGTPDAAPSDAWVVDAGNLLKLGGLTEACGVFDFALVVLAKLLVELQNQPRRRSACPSPLVRFGERLSFN